MSKNGKKFLIICAGVFALGLCMTCIGFATGGIQAFNDGFIWSDGKFVKVERTITAGERTFDDIKSIDISTQDSNIVFEPTAGDKYRLEFTYYEQAGEPDIDISNDRLTVKEKTNYGNGFVGWNFEKTERYIKVYYPKNADFDNIKISSEFGEVDMAGFNCDRCKIAMDDGDLTMTDVETQNLQVENEYGNIDIAGKLLKNTVLISEDGDVDLNLKGVRGIYKFDLLTESGNMAFAGSDVKPDFDEERIHFITGHGMNQVKVDCEYGDVHVNFLGDI